MRKLLCTIIAAFGSLCINADTLEYGLHIRSFPLHSSEFTSIVLDNGLPIQMQGESLELNFDMWVRRDNVFGTVFRVITNNNDNIDLMYRVSEDNVRLPFLLVGEEVYLFEKPTRIEAWLNVELTLHPRTGQLVLRYDEEQISIEHPKLKGVRSVRIAFGDCPFDGFGINDIASVNIKDVRLKRGNQEIRHWRMAQHIGDICYDEIANVPAAGRNIQWIVNERIAWEKVYEQSFDAAPAIAFDEENNRFFVITDSKIYVFSPPPIHKNTEIQINSPSSGKWEFLTHFSNQVLYVPSQQQLIFYNLTEDNYSIFCLTQNRWEVVKIPTREHCYWNNAVVYNPTDSTLISFGGYGHYLYNNNLLIGYPFHADRPKQHTSLPTIEPRYSPASVLVGETLYIFGGRGSPTGRQELSPRNYYDLYSVDLISKEVTPLWSMQGNPSGGNFVPSENMIYDSENQSFYVFTTQSGGVLIRMNTEEAAFERMSLPIGIDFSAQYMHTNLFLAPEQKKIYASVILSQVNGESILTIYEMDYPPISVRSVQQTHPPEAQKSEFWELFWFLLGSVLLIIFVIIVWVRFRKERTTSIDSNENTATQKPLIVSPSVFEGEGAEKFYNPFKKSISFLGRFRVFDKEGSDITTLFTPTVKNLLIVLICYSAKDSRGIFVTKLIQLLWNHQSEETAKNSRNVYLSKLRELLKKVGNVTVVTQHGFSKIQMEDDTVCDYLEMMKFFEEKDNRNLEKMLELLTKGAMLPNVEVDWLDTFKNDFANAAINFLCRILKENNLPDSLKLRIADALAQYDFLSEEALQAKCSVLSKQGKIGLAKNVYDAFCGVYMSSLGQEYPYSFMQVVEEKVEV
jgi:DNA-binding SARP family transcriptional activator